MSLDTQWNNFFNQNAGGIPILEQWLKRIPDLIPSDCKGVVVGQHPAVRDPYATEVLQSLDCYKTARPLGSPTEICFDDELAERIVRASEARDFGPKYRASYGSRMLTDASIGGDSLQVLLLNLPRSTSKLIT